MFSFHALCLPALIFGASHDEPTFAFEAVAVETRDALGAGEAQTFLEVVDGPSHVRLDVGSFDVRFPVASLQEAPHLELFQEAVQTLIDLQENWFAWRTAGGDSEQVEDDWSQLRKFVKGWKTGKFGQVNGGTVSLYEQLGAKDTVLEAVARLSELTATPAEAAAEVGAANVLVLEPTREQFIRSFSLAGLLEPLQRAHLWSDGTVAQTATWCGWTQIACLEQIAFPFDLEKPYQGRPHSGEDPTGFAQYLAERGSVALLRKEFYRHGTHFFEETLGTNLVIAAVGKNDLRQGVWKLEYKTAGGSTQPFERFVPGGNPQGGTLPKRKAHSGPKTGSAMEISKYRGTHGEGFFLGVLKEGQKAGAKLASKDKANPLRKNKIAHFELYSFETSEPLPVTAPFLGAQAENKTLPPNEYLDDYEDFYRAYRSGFFHWLRTKAVEGDEEASEARFQELIRAQRARDVGTPMHEVVQAVYGVPMSSADPETESLEWAFLEFVKKGR